MSTLPDPTRDDAVLDVRVLSDALSIGLDLLDLFAADDCCGLWLGDDAGAMRDFVVCTADRGRDIDPLVRYALVAASLTDSSRALVWRTVDDLADGPGLASGYFERRERFADHGVLLVDEIALGDDDLRSLAITTFTDEPGWDDVSARLDDLLADET